MGKRKQNRDDGNDSDGGDDSGSDVVSMLVQSAHVYKTTFSSVEPHRCRL